LTPRKHAIPELFFLFLANSPLCGGSYCLKFRARGTQMDEEVDAMRGILLGVLTGASVWFMVYVAMFQ
jgi:hypothetical protein